MPNLCIIPARALEDRTLTPMELRALLAVGLYTNSAGKGVWASQTTMAERAGMSRQGMNASLRALQEKGYIRKYGRANPTTGAQMTCLIDIIFDAPPVSESGTAPVLEPETPPVLEPETQTTHKNVPTTSTADAALPAEYLSVYHEVLATARNPKAVAAAVVAITNGMHGTFTWETVGRALFDMHAAGATFSPRTLLRFCEGVVAPPPPRTNGRKPKLDVTALARELASEESSG